MFRYIPEIIFEAEIWKSENYIEYTLMSLI